MRYKINVSTEGLYTCKQLELSSGNPICQLRRAGEAKTEVFECDSVYKKPMYIQDLYLLNRVQTSSSANPHKVTTMH